ncbi:MAG: DUF3343 domain-containing protein [Coriobacteriia bacterium]|nr:DUF3343 domain-containing protein [Coriobacteriia bacterium]
MAAKEPQVVVTFPTTAEAMHMQSAAKGSGLQGRLAPIPRQLSAGCGFAWREPAANRAELEELLRTQAVEFEALVELPR